MKKILLLSKTGQSFLLNLRSLKEIVPSTKGQMEFRVLITVVRTHINL